MHLNLKVFVFLSFREFEEHEQPLDEIVPEEPEIKISREQLLANYQVC
jgi:hypothetical protein